MAIEKFTDAEFREWLGVFLMHSDMRCKEVDILMQICCERCSYEQMAEITRLFLKFQKKHKKIVNKLIHNSQYFVGKHNAFCRDMTLKYVNLYMSNFAFCFYTFADYHANKMQLEHKKEAST